MKKLRMHSFRNYLAALERSIDTKNNYTRIPKKILIDPFLSLKERQTWMMLASFLYTSERYIFPSRQRLAKLLYLNNIQQVSKITKSLQDKGYLSKSYDRMNRVMYELYFLADVDESAFYNEIDLDGNVIPDAYSQLEATRKR